MINIRKATATDTAILALLGRITYVESHGQYIEDINALNAYINSTFSIAKTEQELNKLNNLYYIMYVDDLPVGYAKLVLNENHEILDSQHHCLLDKIYILNEFIPLKIGQQFLNFLEQEAQENQQDAMWLSVYIKNTRAIRFYERNDFKNVGSINFNVSGIVYENSVFSKAL